MYSALGGILNCPYELIAPRVLDQVSDGTGLYRVGDAAALQDARQGDHLDVRHLGLDACDRLNPVHVWHQDVHQDHVRPQPACQLDRFAAIGSLADHRDRGLPIEEHPQPLPHNPVVGARRVQADMVYSELGPGASLTLHLQLDFAVIADGCVIEWGGASRWSNPLLASSWGSQPHRVVV